MLDELRHSSKVPEVKRVDTDIISAPKDLPPFRSSALVALVNDVANDAGLELKDIAYSLDDTPTQPYLRYRVGMSVVAAYPQVRQFAERLLERGAHLTLDGITCARSEPARQQLTCDLAVSGLFEKNVHG